MRDLDEFSADLKWGEMRLERLAQHCRMAAEGAAVAVALADADGTRLKDHLGRLTKIGEKLLQIMFSAGMTDAEIARRLLISKVAVGKRRIAIQSARDRSP